MRIKAGILAAVLLCLPAGAFAANDEGVIAAIDAEAMTITLENGNTYALPGEFDLEAIAEGMDVVILYEEVEGTRQITDMDMLD